MKVKYLNEALKKTKIASVQIRTFRCPGHSDNSFRESGHAPFKAGGLMK
ncbi:hypothetical protein [Bacillus amyloliquefaciens]|nr:hypothetical protein [Bacillus amyloliquefaciens]MEB4595378.1 hypothetical protein [Bacillus amyloliquefaciens]